MFKMFAILVNLASGQAQSVIEPTDYSTFAECAAAIPAKYAMAEETMSKKPLSMLISMGCANFEPPKLPGA